MANIIKKAKDGLGAIKENTLDKTEVDDAVIDRLKDIGGFVADKAGDVKEKADDVRDDIDDKIHELDNMLKEVVNEYNDAFTLMNDKGVQLFIERNKSLDTIELSEKIVNSIANHPKEFDADLEEIETDRKRFVESCEFAERELEAARAAANKAGAGVVAGASVAFMAPTAAMWIATTFGTASTGAAISTLSGAAATNAALAWIGGGTLTMGGGGIAGGQALLALAGPIGWSIAGATLLTSIILFARKRMKLNKEKNSEIESVKANIERVREMDAKIDKLLAQTTDVKNGLDEMCYSCMSMFDKDYADFTSEQKQKLGSLVNNTKTLSAMFNMGVE